MSVITCEELSVRVCRLYERRIAIESDREPRLLNRPVRLTGSEYKFCIEYAEDFEKRPSYVRFDDIIVKKESVSSFSVSKGCLENVTTPRDFWTDQRPFCDALLHLMYNDVFPVEQLLDIHILTKKMSKEDIKERKWPETEISGINVLSGLLKGLRLLKKPQNRKVDFTALDKFAEKNRELFNSYVELLYLNRHQ